MTDITGLVVQGNNHKNRLSVEVGESSGGDRLIYNVIDAGGGSDTLWGDYNGKITISKVYGAQLFGEDGNDDITDSVGNDTLSGGAGDDLITYEYGKDVIDGGDGEDTLKAVGKVLASDGLAITGIEKLYIANNAKIGDLDLTQFDSIVSLSILSFKRPATIDDVNFAGSHIDLVGTAFDDHFDVSNTATRFTISGGGGDDVMVGSQRGDYLSGQAGNDTLTGGSANDSITGGAGDDIVNGAGGNDYLFDNHGSNTIHGGEGNDRLVVTEAGHDRFYGDDGNDVITLGAGKGTAEGGAGDDSFVENFYGVHGRWSLNGGTGEDRLYASGDVASDSKINSVEQLYLQGTLTIDPKLLDSFAGVHDAAGHEINFSHGGDFTWKKVKDDLSSTATLHGSVATDHIDLSASNGLWFVDASNGNDTVILGKHLDSGFPEYNTALGGSGDDWLMGGASDDLLSGGSGDDVLIGTAGTDGMDGGEGKDTFVFTEIRGQTGIDDFTAKGPSHDVIDLSAVKSVRNFSDLMVHHTVQYDGYLVVWFGHNNIFLEGITVKDLNASDFQF